MEQLPKEAVSTLHDTDGWDKEQSLCDLTMDFSFDRSLNWGLYFY